MYHSFTPEAKRRERLAELVASFFLGKVLLIVTHFVWIWFYPPLGEYFCWDRQHRIFLFALPITVLALNLLVQVIIYSVQQSKKMIVYGSLANVNFYLSQTLYMSTHLLPHCFSLHYVPLLFTLIGLVPYFLESRQFILILRDVSKPPAPSLL